MSQSFSISRNTFLGVLQSVANVVERRHTLPILANIRMEVKDDTLTLVASDTEIELQASTSMIPTGIEALTTIPARKLLDICRSLPEDADLTFDIDETKVLLSSGRSRFTLSTLPADDFPLMEAGAVNQTLQVTQKQLHQLIANTSFAMAHQDVRYYLNGMLLEAEGSHLRAIATDGHRLSLAETELSQPATELTQAIVPRKAVLELGRLVNDSEDTIELILTPNQIVLTVDRVRFTSKLVDGRFPAYGRVIPQDNDKMMVADCATLKGALTRAAILSNEKARGIRLSLTANTLTIHAQNPEHEEAEDAIEVDYDNESLEIGFNVNYIIDVLNVVPTESLTLELSSPSSSGVVHVNGDLKATHVIMPMKL